jgi:phosphodiesterase/alkaline phosphatase D-like protein
MLSRRLTLTALAGAWPLSVVAGRQREDHYFRHGVASGDPTPTSVVIWTRVSGVNQPTAVYWEVSLDENFDRRIASGTANTGPGRDFTVKAVATELKPGQRYSYRFRLHSQWSPVGHTRTLPLGKVDRLRLAVASCSNYCFGYFNAYDAIARDSSLDYVVHTGDYLYEYGAGEWGDDSGIALDRRHFPAHEMVSLQDYRQRHAQYKLDAGAQAMHAAHPCILIWDDHEITNNPWTGGAQNHQPASEGDWIERRQAALQAWYEWMPVRDPASTDALTSYWRTLVFGDLATLVCLETRHTARAEQIEYLKHANQITDAASRDHFLQHTLGASGRRMLSAEMERDIESALRASKAAGQPWRLIGNAIPMARMPVPDLSSLPFVSSRSTNPDVQHLVWKAQWNLPWYTDTWDGYPWARQRFYQQCAAADVHDLVVLTGDSHSFWINQLEDDSGTPMGMELGTTGITSPGDFVDLGFSRDEALQLDQRFMQALSEIIWTDSVNNGYLKVDLTRETIEVSCVAVSTIRELSYQTSVIKQARITQSNDTLKLEVL